MPHLGPLRVAPVGKRIGRDAVEPVLHRVLPEGGGLRLRRHALQQRVKAGQRKVAEHLAKGELVKELLNDGGGEVGQRVLEHLGHHLLQVVHHLY